MNGEDEDGELFKNEITENTMYISPNLIKQILKTDDLGSVRKLNLSIAKQWNRKIQVINIVLIIEINVLVRGLTRCWM